MLRVKSLSNKTDLSFHVHKKSQLLKHTYSIPYPHPRLKNKNKIENTKIFKGETKEKRKLEVRRFS